VRDLLVERFGPGVAPGGAVDRSTVAARVFDDPEQRGWLESVLWPRVGARVASWRQEVEALDPPPRAAVIEVPLLFEAGMESIFDKTIAVVADEAVRSERAAARGHELVEARAARQLSQDEKAMRADIVVHNDGSLDDLERRLAEALERL
jgi:dephospho-CoA kinase